MARGQFGVIVGMDGSGKSTIMKSLKKRGYNVTDWKNLRDFDETAYLAPPRPRELREKLKPFSRAMFVAAHLVAEYEYLVDPLLSKGESVILDSYYYKWVAKEKIFEQTHPIFFSICDTLPRPNLVIVLDTSPEVAFARKEKLGLTRFEYFDSPILSDFAQYQGKVMQLVLESAKEIPQIWVSGNKEMTQVEEELCEKLTGISWPVNID